VSDNNYDLQVLFVNGVNTRFGGSVSESNAVWFSSFKKSGIIFDKLNTANLLNFNKKNLVYYISNSLYFLPGTIFRLLKLPVFEFLYKLSLITVIKFFLASTRRRVRRIIFSHHSIFYLALFCSRAKRIFLIHDLIYSRGRSKGASRRMQRLFLNLELRIYRLAPILLVQSYHEWRVLKRFLDSHIYLISCYDLNFESPHVDRQSALAVVSDWRRSENVHGAIQFFSNYNVKEYTDRELILRFFGFNSQKIVERLKKVCKSSNIKIVDGGVFDKVSDIPEGFFFVPIYQGAGIKRKTLEAFGLNRMVIGTKAAFIGLPSWIISDITLCVTSISDVLGMPDLPDEKVFRKALDDLAQIFRSIGEIPDLK
jgi:hypothetical protein